MATHFHDVFNEQLLNPHNMPITFCHMQVIFCVTDESISEGDESTASFPQLNGIKASTGENITYLYKVTEGLSLDSHAGKCALLCGVPTRVVQRARHVRLAYPNLYQDVCITC